MGSPGREFLADARAPVGHSPGGAGPGRGLHARPPSAPGAVERCASRAADVRRWERFAAHVAHELRTPVTLQRALVRHNVTGGRIEIATRTEAEHAVLSVANTGRLIPTDELPRLFQPFQRLSSQPRGCAHGVGLGLAIVQAIADAHDAVVAAHPRAGGGLTIDIRFPATIDTACARSGEQLRPTTGP